MTHPLKHCDNCAFHDTPRGSTVCKYCVEGGQGGTADHWKPLVGKAPLLPTGAPIAKDRQVGGDHYINLGVQPWAAMESWMSEEEFAGFLRGNVIKYVARCRSKGGLEDLEKARHYLDKLIEALQ